MNIFVETLTGRKFEISISPLETIGALKSKIHLIEGIPASHQHLLWQNEELDDRRSIGDYSLTDGSTLRMVVKLRGGPLNARRSVPFYLSSSCPRYLSLADYIANSTFAPTSPPTPSDFEQRVPFWYATALSPSKSKQGQDVSVVVDPNKPDKHCEDGQQHVNITNGTKLRTSTSTEVENNDSELLTGLAFAQQLLSDERELNSKASPTVSACIDDSDDNGLKATQSGKPSTTPLLTIDEEEDQLSACFDLTLHLPPSASTTQPDGDNDDRVNTTKPDVDPFLDDDLDDAASTYFGGGWIAQCQSGNRRRDSSLWLMPEMTAVSSLLAANDETTTTTTEDESLASEEEETEVEEEETTTQLVIAAAADELDFIDDEEGSEVNDVDEYNLDTYWLTYQRPPPCYTEKPNKKSRHYWWWHPPLDYCDDADLETPEQDAVDHVTLDHDDDGQQRRQYHQNVNHYYHHDYSLSNWSRKMSDILYAKHKAEQEKMHETLTDLKDRMSEARARRRLNRGGNDLVKVDSVSRLDGGGDGDAVTNCSAKDIDSGQLSEQGVPKQSPTTPTPHSTKSGGKKNHAPSTPASPDDSLDRLPPLGFPPLFPDLPPPPPARTTNKPSPTSAAEAALARVVGLTTNSTGGVDKSSPPLSSNDRSSLYRLLAKPPPPSGTSTDLDVLRCDQVSRRSLHRRLRRASTATASSSSTLPLLPSASSSSLSVRQQQRRPSTSAVEGSGSRMMSTTTRLASRDFDRRPSSGGGGITSDTLREDFKRCLPLFDGLIANMCTIDQFAPRPGSSGSIKKSINNSSNDSSSLPPNASSSLLGSSSVASTSRLPPLNDHSTPRRIRCSLCSRRIGIMNNYPCRCGRVFCAIHRYAEAHSCKFDYKAEAKRDLLCSNPLVNAPKLPRI